MRRVRLGKKYTVGEILEDLSSVRPNNNPHPSMRWRFFGMTDDCAFPRPLHVINGLITISGPDGLPLANPRLNQIGAVDPYWRTWLRVDFVPNGSTSTNDGDLSDFATNRVDIYPETPPGPINAEPSPKITAQRFAIESLACHLHTLPVSAQYDPRAMSTV